jgi:hypothetical protein
MIKVNFFYLTLKTEYKLEFYLKYPENVIRKFKNIFNFVNII